MVWTGEYSENGQYNTTTTVYGGKYVGLRGGGAGAASASVMTDPALKIPGMRIEELVFLAGASVCVFAYARNGRAGPAARWFFTCAAWVAFFSEVAAGTGIAEALLSAGPVGALRAVATGLCMPGAHNLARAINPSVRHLYCLRLVMFVATSLEMARTLGGARPFGDIHKTGRHVARQVAVLAALMVLYAGRNRAFVMYGASTLQSDLLGCIVEMATSPREGARRTALFLNSVVPPVVTALTLAVYSSAACIGSISPRQSAEIAVIILVDLGIAMYAAYTELSAGEPGGDDSEDIAVGHAREHDENGDLAALIEGCRDPVVLGLIKDLAQRSVVGVKKYGTTLDRDDLTTEQWVRHAREEILDQLAYNAALSRRLEKLRERGMLAEEAAALPAAAGAPGVRTWKPKEQNREKGGATKRKKERRSRDSADAAPAGATESDD